jgi:hypothetical protein
MKRRRVLTWHVHGSYLRNLVQSDHTFLLPVRPGRPEGYGGRSGQFAWPDNVVDVPAESVGELDFDVVLFQSARNYLVDQFEILTPSQRARPRIFLEHNTPRSHPTDARHVVDDPGVLLVHCTTFNALMWDSGRTPSLVIPHGVAVDADITWTGDLGRGISVVNGLARRGRLAGADLFTTARSQVPLDLAGMGSERWGGLGDLSYRELHRTEARYRFFFNPIRYTSLPLAVVEAMAIGMPVVALATTELPRAIADGKSGFLSNDLSELVDGMRRLLRDEALARAMGKQARSIARDRFGIERFRRDWNSAIERALDEGT